VRSGEGCRRLKSRVAAAAGLRDGACRVSRIRHRSVVSAAQGPSAADQPVHNGRWAAAAEVHSEHTAAGCDCARDSDVRRPGKPWRRCRRAAVASEPMRERREPRRAGEAPASTRPANSAPRPADTGEGTERPAPMIFARGLRKSFPGLSGQTVEAVRGIDVQVQRGESFGFLGPNGAGKSSTMRMIACVSPRTGGELSILGLDPELDGIRIGGRLGVVPQEDNLDLELTVRENLFIRGRYFGISRSECRRRAQELIEFAQLTEKADTKVDALSGGMKRRLTIARSLINDPELLLLDEPTTGLDPQARHALWDRLFRLKNQGVTLVVTTHYMDEAEQLCDRLVVMDGGVVVAEGSPTELIGSYSSREVLELRFMPDAQQQAEPVVVDLVERVEVLPDRLLLYTQDGEATLEVVYARGVRPRSTLVRRSTLEDVFLRLTGRRLVD